MYADPENPESWEHYEVHHASMVVACYIGEAFENIESKVILPPPSPSVHTGRTSLPRRVQTGRATLPIPDGR